MFNSRYVFLVACLGLAAGCSPPNNARPASQAPDGDRRVAQQAQQDGDRLYSRTKVQNFEAIRQANRQVRVSGAQSPSIVLIILPEVAPSDLGCYAGRDLGTPNLDRLAAEGMRFTNFYAGSPLPIPARACLQTGRHSGHVNLRRTTPPNTLESGETTLAEVLWHGGYSTFGVGRWDLGDSGTSGAPYAQGFDLWFGSLDRNAARAPFPSVVWRNMTQVQVNGTASGAPVAANGLFSGEAEALISIQASTSRRMFLLVSYADLAASGIATKDRRAQVSQLDAEVGRIITALERRGMLGSTLFLVTSDVPGAPAKPEIANALAESRLKVPLLMRWPRLVPAGGVDERPSAHWDLLPTIATAIGAWRVPPLLDGIPLIQKTLPKPTAIAREMLYWEIHEPAYARAVRYGNWWAMSARASPWQLYDLAADPLARKNVAAAHGDTLKKIDRFARASHVD